MTADQIKTLKNSHQVYYGKPHAIDHCVESAQKVCMPNETLYLIDCTNSDVLCITDNTTRTLGIKGYQINEFTNLYDHITADFTEKFFKITKQIIDVGIRRKMKGGNGSKISIDDLFP